MRRKLWFIPLFLAAALAVPLLCGAEPVEVKLFTSPYCPHCRHLQSDGFAEQFAARHKGQIRLVHYDVTKDANNILFSQTMQACGVKARGIPAMVIGERVLMGYPRSINTADDVLAEVLSAQEAVAAPAPAVSAVWPETSIPAHAAADSAVPAPSSAENSALEQHEQMFNNITFWAIMGAGLADGINPCAFAVIVFFISFLSVYKYNRKEIILVGSAYCASVFAAYVLLGLGAFRFLYAMKGFALVTAAIQWATIGLCALFFALSLYDFIIYTRTKKSDKLILQLPKSYKEYIHKVMRFFLRDKKSSAWRLLLAACAVGFVVSAVEAVCTGQVYLPTIMVILKEANRHFFRAAEYLLLYNLMFIVPLVLVFVLALCGKESSVFNNWLKKHLGLTKLLLCGVFLGLLLLLLFNR